MTVKEARNLEQGISVDGVTYFVLIRCIIADAPARSFLKQCKPHNSYYGCERCIQKGSYYNRRVVFDNVSSELRTDNTFSSKLFESHHDGDSPLLVLNFGLVSQFPLDYMHLICIGITKKLVTALFKGPVPYKIKSIDILRISQRLLRLAPFVSNDFVRSQRPLSELKHWKATEYRLFLLYTGPIALKGILCPEKYNHFMLLSQSIRILLDDSCDTEWLEYARLLISKFVKNIPKIYSREFLVYNVHSVLHLPDDVKHFGSLERCSAFKFESYLRVIKRALRSHNNFLEQAVNRICELEASSLEAPPVRQERKLTVKSTPPDNCFRTSDDELIVVSEDSDFSMDTLFCRRFKTRCDFLTSPFPSSLVNQWIVNNLSSVYELAKAKLKSKCLLFPFNETNDFVCIGMINAQL